MNKIRGVVIKENWPTNNFRVFFMRIDTSTSRSCGCSTKRMRTLFDQLSKHPAYRNETRLDINGKIVVHFYRIEYDAGLDRSREKRDRFSGWRSIYRMGDPHYDKQRRAMRFLAYLMQEIEGIRKKTRYHIQLIENDENQHEYHDALVKHIMKGLRDVFDNISRFRWYAETLDFD